MNSVETDKSWNEFSVEKEVTEKLCMNHKVILDIIEGIEDTKACIKDELISRKVKSKEETVESHKVEMEAVDGLEVEKEVVKLPIDSELSIDSENKTLCKT